MSAPQPAPQSSFLPARPLFGGYALVAACAAWLAGITLRPAEPWTALGPWVWLGIAAGCGIAALGLYVVAHHRAAVLRLVVAGLILGFWLALGAARAAWADPASDPRSVAALPQGISVELRGDVAAEPILESDGRLLVVQLASASLDHGAAWQTATGRIEVHLAGPDDWFAPGYGDTLQLTGKLAPVTRGAPVGVLARLVGAYAQIEARGGGNPILTWLFALRVRLAQGIQRTGGRGVATPTHRRGFRRVQTARQRFRLWGCDSVCARPSPRLSPLAESSAPVGALFCV